jgi:GAF domain-containing protein
VALTDADGRRTGTVTTVTDITERKLAEVELRMRLAGHEAVAELSDWALSGEPVETLVHGVAAAVADLLGVEHVAVAEATPGGREVVPRATVGWNPKLIGRSLAVAPTSPSVMALEGEGPVVVSDLDADGPFESPPVAAEAGMRSAVIVGVGDGLGVICAHSEEVDAFSNRDLSFLHSLAELLASRWKAQPPELATVQ